MRLPSDAQRGPARAGRAALRTPHGEAPVVRGALHRRDGAHRAVMQDWTRRRRRLPAAMVAMAAVFLAGGCVRPLTPASTPTPLATSTAVPTSRPTATPSPTPTPVPLGTGPLRADGARLVDAGGRHVRLTGVNWSGMETGGFAPIGLNARNVDDMLDQLAGAGFK